MSSEPILISIVTPVYNGAAYLRRTIQSVLAQQYSSYEHIIIDDGSTDAGKTVAVLSEYPHLVWWSRENRGQYATQNEGLDRARGKVILFLCADDELADAQTLGRIAQTFVENPDLDFAYGDYRLITESGTDYPLQYQTRPWNRARGRRNPFMEMTRCRIAHCALFVKTGFLRAHDLRFDPSLRYVGDYDWMIRLFRASAAAQYLPGAIANYRVQRYSITRSVHMRRLRGEVRTVIARHGGSFLRYRFFEFRRLLTHRLRLAAHEFNTHGTGGLGRLIHAWRSRSANRRNSRDN